MWFFRILQKLTECVCFKLSLVVFISNLVLGADAATERSVGRWEMFRQQKQNFGEQMSFFLLQLYATPAKCFSMKFTQTEPHSVLHPQIDFLWFSDKLNRILLLHPQSSFLKFTHKLHHVFASPTKWFSVNFLPNSTSFCASPAMLFSVKFTNKLNHILCFAPTVPLPNSAVFLFVGEILLRNTT